MNPGKRLILTSLLDKAGMWASALCAIHCIVFPVLITASAFSGLLFLHSHAVENVIFGVSVVLGTSSLFPSYFRHHKKLYPILILLTGLILIGLSRFTVNDRESASATLGAISVALSHFLNYRLCRKWHTKG